MVSVFYSSGLDAGNIASGPGFGKAKGGEPLAAGDLGQIFLFQLIAAEQQDRIGSKTACRKTRGNSDTSLAKLFNSQAVLEYSSAHSTVFFRDIKAEQIRL